MSFIRIFPDLASFRRNHCRILTLFKRCLVTFLMMKVIIGILRVATSLYQNLNHKLIILKKMESMSKGIFFY
jgi:hypothetical protein